MRLAACLVLVLVLACAPAHARDCEKAYVAQHGKAAPCGGVIVPTASAQHCLWMHEVGLPTCTADLQLCDETTRIEAEMWSERLAAADALAAQLETQLVEASRPVVPSWWEHPAILVSLGAVAGASAALWVRSLD